MPIYSLILTLLQLSCLFDQSSLDHQEGPKRVTQDVTEKQVGTGLSDIFGGCTEDIDGEDGLDGWGNESFNSSLPQTA